MNICPNRINHPTFFCSGRSYRLQCHCLFLEKEVDVVNAERGELPVGSFEIEQQTTERNEDSPGYSVSAKPTYTTTIGAVKEACHSHRILGCALLKSVHLAMANVVVVVREGLFARADIPPARASVLLAVQRQGRGQRQRERLAHGTRVELRVHIEGECDGCIGGIASQTRHPVVLLGIDRGDCEGVFEQKRIGHGDSCDRERREVFDDRNFAIA